MYHQQGLTCAAAARLSLSAWASAESNGVACVSIVGGTSS